MVLQRYLVATYDMTPQFKRLNKNVIDSNTKHLKGFAIGQEKLTIITKRQKRNDRRNERNLCNCVKKPEKEKKFRTSTGFEPVTSRYRCDALPTEL